ncbi:EmrB/QacA subfamily drug resistance transporter [Kibdelosporangium banguiense]|uniref:EmrB/QacA subfamily drug resistance transporter n=1 Tax=Kibdelosporangium banguiense TaxID=1365924 RepID=A0ABS4TWA1_9PSEU|nr:MDR family MFS transporter [Kibdelosporangium banguiense]MBP2328253.1 EmrB/QacA subfamily drug resistance transporter [Kibdelosporangium banguiense]
MARVIIEPEQGKAGRPRQEHAQPGTDSVPPPPHTAGTQTMSPARVRAAFAVLLLAMLLAMLDNTVVGTAMPTIVAELGGLAHLSWVVTAYTLTTAASTPIWGKLGDLYGRKNVHLSAIALFTAASVACGFAQGMTQLIVFRALQGLGGGGLAVGALSLIGVLVPPRERGRYQGMTASVMAVGQIGGPLVGGWVTSLLGWRWNFYLNLPLGLLVLIATVVVLGKCPTPRRRVHFDFRGAFLLTTTITALLLLTSSVGNTLLLSVVTFTAFAGFVLVERRSPEPVLPLGLFAHRNIALTTAIIFVVGVVSFGVITFVPLFQQNVQGVSAADSGTLLLPMTLAVVVASQLAGRLSSRTGRYRIFPIAGTGCLTAGCGLLATLQAGSPVWFTSGALVLVGFGLGLSTQMMTLIAQNTVPVGEIGVATANTTMFRTIGGAIGTSVFGALLAGAAHPGRTTEQGLVAGFSVIFAIAAVVSGLAFVAAWWIKQSPLRQAVGPDAES